MLFRFETGARQRRLVSKIEAICHIFAPPANFKKRLAEMFESYDEFRLGLNFWRGDARTSRRLELGVKKHDSEIKATGLRGTADKIQNTHTSLQSYNM